MIYCTIRYSLELSKFLGLSEEVTELPPDNSVQIASMMIYCTIRYSFGLLKFLGLQINMLIAHDDYHYPIKFGKVIPFHKGCFLYYQINNT